MKEILKYLETGVKYDIKEIFNPPSNRNDSIQYLLFTPENPHNALYIEPTENCNHTLFNRSCGVIFITHGYLTRLGPGNIFEKIKDAILATGCYNIIILNWFPYAVPPYALAIVNTLLVGNKVAEMIQCIINRTGIPADRFHLIGHSLGAHLFGIVGKNIPNIGRLSGEGLGLYQSIGWSDFFPNGGNHQPHCQKGNVFDRPDGTNLKLETFLDLAVCNHEISLQYFLYSIQNCTFLGTECESYSDLENCRSESKSTAIMGFFIMVLRFYRIVEPYETSFRYPVALNSPIDIEQITQQSTFFQEENRYALTQNHHLVPLS
ncbi:pancreatic triacylglycerol lipase [Nephila pilipes]|uniref:Pancreatic triacylglycerol lipase n=1 Tax=Nephila pilipes TaxID=299642 RepID=A0A8X6TQM1_NEPPI|nr:pancreatic triacylglycerol lipase [Nephila pilipes]